jgi:AraC-like DNA-binding protein
MTDERVQEAAEHYDAGESLQTVAARFGVDARTLSREFKNAGIAVRARNGWPPGGTTQNGASQSIVSDE